MQCVLISAAPHSKRAHGRALIKQSAAAAPVQGKQ